MAMLAWLWHNCTYLGLGMEYATGKQLRHCLLSTALEMGDPDLGAGMVDPDFF